MINCEKSSENTDSEDEIYLNSIAKNIFEATNRYILEKHIFDVNNKFKRKETLGIHDPFNMKKEIDANDSSQPQHD